MKNSHNKNLRVLNSNNNKYLLKRVVLVSYLGNTCIKYIRKCVSTLTTSFCTWGTMEWNLWTRLLNSLTETRKKNYAEETFWISWSVPECKSKTKCRISGIGWLTLKSNSKLWGLIRVCFHSQVLVRNLRIRRSILNSQLLIQTYNNIKQTHQWCILQMDSHKWRRRIQHNPILKGTSLKQYNHSNQWKGSVPTMIWLTKGNMNKRSNKASQ